MKKTRTEDCKLIRILGSKESRGCLHFINFRANSLPFEPLRLFYITNVTKLSERGNHAHKLCAQFLIAITGKIRIDVNDGYDGCQYELFSSDTGLYVPPGIWASQTYLTENSNLAALASHEYDPEDYINNLSEFYKYKND